MGAENNFDNPPAHGYSYLKVNNNSKATREQQIMITYTVLLKDGTVGEINSDTLEGQSPESFIGEVVRVKLHDENGNAIEVEGRLAEVLTAISW